jgi:hypothetical protein
MGQGPSVRLPTAGELASVARAQDALTGNFDPQTANDRGKWSAKVFWA